MDLLWFQKCTQNLDLRFILTVLFPVTNITKIHCIHYIWLPILNIKSQIFHKNYMIYINTTKKVKFKNCTFKIFKNKIIFLLKIFASAQHTVCKSPTFIIHNDCDALVYYLKFWKLCNGNSSIHIGKDILNNKYYTYSARCLDSRYYKFRFN